MPRAKRVKELSWAEREKRETLLREIVTIEQVCARLRSVLPDRTYRGAEQRLKWDRFARECFPEFSPPLERWELFDQMQHYMPAGRRVPRSMVWWAVRVYAGAEDPDTWLLAERKRLEEASNHWANAGDTGPVERLAEKLGNSVSTTELYVYLARLRKEANRERNSVLSELVTMERVGERLRGVLRVPVFRSREGKFDWARFVQQCFPEVSPPLTQKEMFHHLRRYMPAGQRVPGSMVWWAVRVYVGAEDPDAWLLAEHKRLEEAGERWPLERIAERLGGVVSIRHIGIYLSAVRKRQEAETQEQSQVQPRR